MNPRTPIFIAIIAVLTILAAVGCRTLSDLEPAPPNTDPIVFDDEFGHYVTYEAFRDSYYDAISVDANEKVIGTTSLNVLIPAGGWSGGAFTTSLVRDLSGYNALTFWAKSSKSSTMNVAGLGNDNTGTSKYTAQWEGFELTTSWTKYIIPVPIPAKLSSERGLFFFAEASEEGESHNVWFDEVKFEVVSGITNPRPVLTIQEVSTFVGATVGFEGTRTTFEVNGFDQTIQHMSGYFNYTSSNEAVAVTEGDRVRAVGSGTATITADLDGITATGYVTLNVSDAPDVPAPTPTHPQADVISIFSNAYAPGVTVDTWFTDWSYQASYTDFEIEGDDVKVYTYSTIGYAGVDFSNEMIDATSMNYFHIDVWVPEGSLNFKVKLVDFGPNGTYEGPYVVDDSESEIVFCDGCDITLVAGTWNSVDIPIEMFMAPAPDGLTDRGHIAQLIFAGFNDNSFVDNIYFHK